MEETRAPVLDPGARKTKTGYCRALAAFCRSTVDGYAGYNRLIAPGRVGPGIQLAYCWAHARRKLVEITRAGTAPIALP